MSNNKRKEILSKILLICLGIIIALVIVEFPLRFLNLRPFENILIAHPIYHHALVPNAKAIEVGPVDSEYKVFHDINKWGFRGGFYPKHKEKDVFRILMLGDSFTQGLGVEDDETFSRQLETFINTAGAKKRIEVLNMGLISYSPTLEHLVFKNIGIDFNPDLVVLNFDMSDIQDEYKYSKYHIKNNGGDIISVRPGEFDGIIGMLFCVDQELIKKSVSYCYLRVPFQRLYDRVNKWRKKIKRWYHKKVLKDWIKKDWITIGDIKTDRYAILRDEVYPEIEPYWQLSFSAIKKIDSITIANNIEFVLAVYPYGHQISPREWGKGRTDWHFDKDRVYASTYPFDRLRKFSKDNNITFLSAKKAFLDSKEYPLFFDFDGHFTPLGHKLYAKTLYDFLRRNHLIP